MSSSLLNPRESKRYLAICSVREQFEMSTVEGGHWERFALDRSMII